MDNTRDTHNDPIRQRQKRFDAYRNFHQREKDAEKDAEKVNTPTEPATLLSDFLRKSGFPSRRMHEKVAKSSHTIILQK